MEEIRKGSAPPPVVRAAFRARFRADIFDAALRSDDESIARFNALAWRACSEARRSAFTLKTGAGYADALDDVAPRWILTKAPWLQVEDLLLRATPVDIE